MTTVTRPILRYHGGKWRLAPWIIEHFPQHSVYVEAFGGAASVLLMKSPAPLEIYNDLWDRLVGFWRVLREQPNELYRLLQLTPWARSEFYQSFERVDDPLEDARRFFVQSWQGIGGLRGQAGAKGKRGWRFFRNIADASEINSDGLLDNLLEVASRLRHVQLECDDAIAVMRRYDSPDTLHYVDPPYTGDTRRPGHQQSYFAEMTATNHRHLAFCLHRLQGQVVLSGYQNALYDELYEDWRTDTVQTLDNGGNHRTECLWLSPRFRDAAAPLFNLEQP